MLLLLLLLLFTCYLLFVCRTSEEAVSFESRDEQTPLSAGLNRAVSTHSNVYIHILTPPLSRSMVELREFVASENVLENVPVSLFELPNLEVLYLDQNKLTALPSSVSIVTLSHLCQLSYCCCCCCL